MDDETRSVDRDGPWSGVVYVGVGLVSAWVFASGRGPPDTGELIASVLVVVYGLATLFVTVFSNLVSKAGDTITGCFWMAVGLGIAVTVIAFPVGRPLNGLVLGTGVALFGLFVALDL